MPRPSGILPQECQSGSTSENLSPRTRIRIDRTRRVGHNSPLSRCRKSIRQNPAAFQYKSRSENFLNIIQGGQPQPTAHVILNNERLKAFLPRPELKAECPRSSEPPSTALEFQRGQLVEEN